MKWYLFSAVVFTASTAVTPNFNPISFFPTKNVTVLSQLPTHWQERASPPARKHLSFIIVPLGSPTKESSGDPSPLSAMSDVSDGTMFDIDGDGVYEQVAWPRPASGLAFLAIDRNANGAIDNGTELIGGQTLPGAFWGFDVFEQMEKHSGDGTLTDEDPLFAKLLLWTDYNANGRSEPEELRPARSVLAKIGLGYFTFDKRDRQGNMFDNRGWSVLRTDNTNKADEKISPIFEVAPNVRRAPLQRR